jgi:hypothetical protein
LALINPPRQKWPVKRADPTGLTRFAIPKFWGVKLDFWGGGEKETWRVGREIFVNLSIWFINLLNLRLKIEHQTDSARLILFGF